MTDILEAAVHEGRRIATGNESRGLINAFKNIAGQAVQIVGGIIEQLKEKAREILDAIFGSGEIDDVDAAIAEAETELEEWAADYSDLVAITEVTAAIEEAIIDEAIQQGAEQIWWVDSPGACEYCIANAEASPLPIGSTFPSGDQVPPAHPRCRCTTATT